MSSSFSCSLGKYDVFLSFKGVDTGKGFVSHLFHSLNRRSIRTFKDENELTGGVPLSPELIENIEIERSKLGVVVISENYASSVWCLDVLAKMIERREKGSLIVVSVLYEVNASDVERQIEQLAEDPEKKVKTWRDALTKLFQYGRSFLSLDWEDDSAFINEITTYISGTLRGTKLGTKSSQLSTLSLSEPHKVASERARATGELTAAKHEDKSYISRDLFSGKSKRPKYMYGDRGRPTVPTTPPYQFATRNILDRSSDGSNGLVGMDRHLEALNQPLALGSNNKDVHIIGICGREGVGKTTIARFLYDKFSRQFQNHCFLKNDREIHEARSPPRLLEEFMSKALKTEALTTKGSKASLDGFKTLVGHRKLLLVADSVDDKEQLKDLVKDASRFGPGSRVIVTTQEKSMLLDCGVKHLYEVECLRFDEALQLFCQSAFKQKHPPADFEWLSMRAVQLSGRLPLALKLFGSYLHGSRQEDWKSALHKLEAKQYDRITEVSSMIGDLCPQRDPMK